MKKKNLKNFKDFKKYFNESINDLYGGSLINDNIIKINNNNIIKINIIHI